jgi:hypothetical protein
MARTTRGRFIMQPGMAEARSVSTSAARAGGATDGRR